MQLPTDKKQWVDGEFVDPTERWKCSIFDAIGALVSSFVVPLFTGGEIGGGLLGGLFGGGAEAAAGGLAAEAGLGAAEAGLGAAAGAGLGTAADIGLGSALGSAVGGIGDLFGIGSSALEGVGGGLASGLAEPVLGASALESIAPLGASSVPASFTPAEFLAAGTEGAADFSGNILPLSGLADEVGSAGGSLSGPVAGSAGTDFSAYDLFNAQPSMGGGSDAGVLEAAGKSAGGLKGFLKENKDILSLGAAGIPLAMSLFKGDASIPELNAAKSLAGSTGAVGQALIGSSLSGVLPPGYEGAIDTAKQSAAANIRGQYANLGMSGSTSEAADLAAATSRIDGTRAKLLSELTSQGITAAGQAGTQDLALARIQLAQDKELQDALNKLSTNLVLSSF